MRLEELAASDRELAARLVGAGRLGRSALARAVAEARARRVTLAELLVRDGLASPELARACAEAGAIAAREPALLGRYVMGGIIGTGGMGAVRRGYDPVLHRAVAVKVMNGPGNPEHRERFAREAGAIAALQHEGLIALHDHGDQDGRPYYVMELVDGVPFGDWLEQGPGDVPVARAVRDVALALAHAHDRGLVHRDVKPANVLVDARGRARLADFGLVRRAEGPSLTGSGQILGTPHFMAPEQALDPPGVGPPADVYGLGGLLHFALTGATPHPDGLSLVQLLVWLRDGAVTPAAELAPDAPPELARLAAACLARDPARRPSARLVAADLERFLRPTGAAAPRGCAAVALGALVAFAHWCAIR